MEAGGRLDLVGSTVRVNDATVTLSGAGSLFEAINGLEENRGTLNLLAGRSLDLARAFTNRGVVRIERGILSTDGLTITDDATIRLSLGLGSRGSAWGALDVDGHTSLNGALHIDLVNGFLPDWGMAFDIIRSSTLSGDFDDLLLPTLSDDLRWYTRIDDGDYILGVRDVADANADGVVNFLDLNAVLSDYGMVGAGLLGDVDTDGAVTFMDLNAVLSRYGLTAPRAVPSPGGAAVLTVAAGGCLRRRRHRWC